MSARREKGSNLLFAQREVRLTKFFPFGNHAPVNVTGGHMRVLAMFRQGVNEALALAERAGKGKKLALVVTVEAGNSTWCGSMPDLSANCS